MITKPYLPMGVGVALLAALAFLVIHGCKAPPLGKLIAGIVSLGILGFGIYRYIRWRQLHRESVVKLGNVSDPQSIYIGQGFTWTTRITWIIQSYVRFNGKLPSIQEGRGGSPIFQSVASKFAVSDITIPTANLNSHLSIQGRTQVGKSELLRLITSQIIAQNEGPVIIIDPKGGADLYIQAIADAKKAGRTVKVICPLVPSITTPFNPLSSCQTPVEIQDRIASFFQQTREEFFINQPVHTVWLVAHMQQSLNVPWSINQLYHDAIDRSRLVKLLIRYLNTLTDQDLSGWRGEYDALVEKIDAFVSDQKIVDAAVSELLTLCKMPYDSFIATHRNLTIALGGLIDETYKDMFTAGQGALTMEQIDREKMVVIVLTNSLITRRMGHKIGRLIMQDLIGYAGDRYIRKRDKDSNPITVVVEEASEVLYPDIISAVNKLGEAQVRMIMSWQSESDVYKELGAEGGQSFLANIGTRITMRLSDTKSAQSIAESFGQCELIQHMDSTSMLTHGSDENPTTVRRTESIVQRNLVEPDWLMVLPKGEGFIYDSTLRKFSAPMLPKPDEHAVREMGYGDLLALPHDGDRSDTPIDDPGPSGCP